MHENNTRWIKNILNLQRTARCRHICMRMANHEVLWMYHVERDSDVWCTCQILQASHWRLKWREIYFYELKFADILFDLPVALTLDVTMTKNVLVVFECFVNIGKCRHFNVGFTVWSTVTMADSEMNRLLTISDFTIFQKVKNIFDCRIPRKASKFDNFCIFITHVYNFYKINKTDGQTKLETRQIIVQGEA